MASRREFLGMSLAFGAGVALGARLGLPQALAAGPPRKLIGDADTLVRKVFEDIDPTRVWDSHVHIVGVGAGDTGCWVNPDFNSPWHPWKSFRFDIYKAASGIADMDRADEQYVARLLELLRLGNPEGRLVIYAFDYAVREDGSEDTGHSELYVPNDYVLSLAKKHPEFVPCASIHPYRKDAVAELDRVAKLGARAIKWLPNVQGMDPASERCAPFYRRLAQLKLPLITHSGEERALSAGHQELGNPLRLRRALDAGVRVVVAHCASLGEVEDLDEPGTISAFDAFMRLFTDRRYSKQLFADISAMTQMSRSGRPLQQILLHKDLHARLVYGSDYPLPAIDPLISTRLLSRDGYLDAGDRELLNEIYVANPLLFDFVLKRRIRYEFEGAMHAFAPSVFQTDWLFEGRDPGT